MVRDDDLTRSIETAAHACAELQDARETLAPELDLFHERRQRGDDLIEIVSHLRTRNARPKAALAITELQHCLLETRARLVRSLVDNRDSRTRRWR